jgi:small subunit ribosomal protein S15
METAIKERIKTEYQIHPKDTGSADVQIALLSQQINDLNKHLQANPKDHSSRRGMIMMVAQRRKLLDYVASKDAKRYQTLIKKLNLRK